MPTLAEALAAFALRSYAAGLPDAIFRQGRRVHYPAVAAVSRAGGLGAFGCHYQASEQIRQRTAAIRRGTNRPFGRRQRRARAGASIPTPTR